MSFWTPHLQKEFVPTKYLNRQINCTTLSALKHEYLKDALFYYEFIYLTHLYSCLSHTKWLWVVYNYTVEAIQRYSLYFWGCASDMQKRPFFYIIVKLWNVPFYGATTDLQSFVLAVPSEGTSLPLAFFNF